MANALLEQVKAAILAKIAAMGPCNSDEMRQEVLTQVPAVNSDNMHTLVYQARKQLIEDELIEEDEAMVYDLSDSYYSSEHNPNNYVEDEDYAFPHVNPKLCLDAIPYDSYYF